MDYSPVPKTLHGSKMIIGIIGGHLNNTNQEAIGVRYVRQCFSGW